ncbi:hypothetical protein C8R46DRAFT_1198687 [Mycena filopes]|nr:hypothetical protein C8R46DRAFT_1198687 [Mycena filopes]
MAPPGLPPTLMGFFPTLEDNSAEEWNAKWEGMYPQLLHPNCPATSFNFELARIQNLPSLRALKSLENDIDRGDLCALQREITVECLLVYPREDLQRKWMSATPVLRQKHILVGLAKACSLDRMAKLNDARIYCAHELRLDYLGGDGAVLLDLLKSVSHDDHTVIPETPRYISHPFWDDMFATRAVLNATDAERLATLRIQVLRTKLICHVLQRTVYSFLSLTPPAGPGLTKADKLALEPAWAAAEAMIKPIVQQAFGRKGAKLFLQEGKRFVKGNLARHGRHCTSQDCDQVEPSDGSVKFNVCQPCRTEAHRVISYCSVECQRKDWKPRHKRMCGKPLELKTLTDLHSSFTDVANAPIHATEFIGDPIGGFDRSARLNVQVAWLNLNTDVAFRLVDAERVEGSLRISDPLGAHLFHLYRELAMTKGGIRTVAILGHYMSWATDAVTSAEIVTQLARDFELGEGELGGHVLELQALQEVDPLGKPVWLLCFLHFNLNTGLHKRLVVARVQGRTPPTSTSQTGPSARDWHKSLPDPYFDARVSVQRKTTVPSSLAVFIWLIGPFQTLAAATGTPPPPVTPPTSNQCCNSVVPSSSAAASAVAGLLGPDLSGLDVLVGLSCSPITVGNNCGNTTVVCDAPEKEWGGLIAINCIPITL